MFRALSVSIVLLVGCGSVVALPEAGDATSSTTADQDASGTSPDPPVATSGTLPPDPPPTSTDPFDPTSGEDGGESSTSTNTSTSDGPCGDFICDPSETSSAFECSVWEQDCPAGEKCMPWASDGGSAWNALRCSPIDPDPDGVDEPCTVEGSGVSGIDSCVLGAMCWDVDPETNLGTCVPQCIGSPKAPDCADPNRQCYIAADAVLTLCIAACDPLDPQACAQGEGCYDAGNQFVCAPDASGDDGAALDPCEYINGCDAGLACVDSTSIPGCDPDTPECCSPFCDLGAPSCPSSLACVPYFEDGNAPPAHVDLGICLGA